MKRSKRQIINKYRVLWLVAFTAVSVVIITSITAFLLYSIAMDIQKSRLREIADNQAAIIETYGNERISFHNSYMHPAASYARAYDDTIAFLRKAQLKFPGFGNTGEFSLAKKEGDLMIFVLNQRFNASEMPKPVPFNSQLAEPIRRALSSDKGGIIIGPDYRGKRVLASYQQAGIFGLGIAVKMDISEIEDPFIHAALIMSLFSFAAIVITSVSIYRFGNSAILQLREANQELLGEVAERTKAERELEIANIELEKTNEDLKVANENLTATNEEFESSLEEISASQKELELTLQEKETLLRELHHRTKNNMQVMCALLNLQAGENRDPVLVSALKDTESRIMSMSLVHQKLYQTANLSRINLTEYVMDLMCHVRNSYGVDERRISHSCAIDDIRMPIDTALPLGLVLNELLSNSFKHAFPDSMTGTIHLSITADQEGGISIRYSDNGVGLPDPDGFDNHKSIGIQLILNIVKRQLRGSLSVSGEKGFACEIRLKGIELQSEA